MARPKRVGLSLKLTNAIHGLKKPFLAFSQQFGILAESRAELAPRFMRVHGSYLQEGGGSFVDFVRLLDPSVPADRTAYRAHKGYQAADYLRRLVSRRDVTGNRAKPVRSNLNAMARLIATIQPLVVDQAAFWGGISTEFGLSVRQTTRLKQVVSASQPLIKITAKPQRNVKVIHVAPEAAAPPRRAVA